MPIFEFDEGTRVQVNNTNSGTIDFEDSGVSFSWSVTSEDGRTSIQHQPSSGFGTVRDFLEGKEVSGGTDEFVLSSDGNHFDGTAEAPLQLHLNKVVGKVTVEYRYLDSSETFTQTLDSAGTITAVGEFSEIAFTTNGEFQIDWLEAEVNVNCFLEGTHIATPFGEELVENLRQGDDVLLASGGRARIIWIARQRVLPLLQPAHLINPVCFTAGALADGFPKRDLYITPDHGVLIDGFLINASALINGRTIFQVPRMPFGGFTYYHIETDKHQSIFAEGTPCETFVDYAGRSAFDNVTDHPEPERIVPEMTMPRVTAQRLVPPAIKARLGRRADMLTWRQAS